MSSKVTLLLLALALRALNQSNNCINLMQATPETTNSFQTGYFDIEKTKSQQFTEATIPYKKSKLGIANLGIWLAPLYIHKYKAVDYIDFNVVSAKVKQTSFNIVVGIDPKAQWTFCHIHFIASNRFDLKTGFFFVNDKSFLQAKSGTKVIKQPINEIKYKTSHKVLAFVSISGIKIKDSSFSLIIKGSSFDVASKSLSIEVKLDKVDSNIELFYISYILSSDKGTFLDSSKKTVFQTLPNDPNKQISQVVGMTGINNQVIPSFFKKRLLITGVTVSAQELSTYKKAFEIKQIGIIIENLGTLTLAEQLAWNDTRFNNILFRNNKQKICITSDDCEEGGGQFITFRNGSKNCVLCSSNKTFDTDSQTCICRYNFTLIQKFCICQEPRFYFQNSYCFTIEEARDQCSNLSLVLDEINLKCVCPKGFVEVPYVGGINCTSKCSNGTKFNVLTEKCECPEGLFYIGDKCVRCRLLEIWKQIEGKCECLPGINKKKSGECIRCSPFGKFNMSTDNCECKSGYVGDGRICRARSSILDIGKRI